MKKLTIYADKFFFEDCVKGPGYLIINSNKFESFSKDAPPADGEIIDYTGKWIAPGLVDTHIHGLLGYDVMNNDVDGLKKMAEGLLSCGVTSFLPTTLTASIQSLDAVCETIGKHHKDISGAKIRGIFLEGPFFTEKYKGAQNPKYFSDPNIKTLDSWKTLSNGLIKKIAIAPERADSLKFIKYAKKNGIQVALGHSDATYQEAKNAVENGASIFVHAFNGMSGFHHREPGMVGAAMSLGGVYNELICDGHHVCPQSAKILMDAAGRDRMILISDSSMAGQMPDGDYILGELSITVQDKVARIETGSLAGSVLQLNEALKNVVDWKLATPFEAVCMASINAAKSVALDNVCGKIAPGYDADFIVLNQNLELEATYLNGQKRFVAKKEC